MTRIISSPFTASVLALWLAATSADAQNAATSADAQNRVFVGRNGDDANPCTVVAPCRTFQRAHDVVAANGEIDVLDPAGYSKLIITKAISIQGHAFAGIISTSGDAITINAGVDDKINLRGLHIDGVGTGAYGIHFNTGASLNVQDCLIRNFTHGLVFAPSNPITRTSTAVRFSMSNSLVSDSAGFGIAIQPVAGVVRAVLDHVEMDNNENGLLVQRNDVPAGIYVTLSSSVAANNSQRGIWVLSQGLSRGEVHVMVRNSTITNNRQRGMEVFGNDAIIWVSHSTIVLNGVGVDPHDGGVIESFGDNVLKAYDGNLTSTTPLR
jgi:hypothetical protein